MRPLFRPLFSLLLLPIGFLACVGDDPVVTPTDAGTQADTGLACPAMPSPPSKDATCSTVPLPDAKPGSPVAGEYVLGQIFGACVPKLGSRINLSVDSNGVVTLLETRTSPAISASLRRTLTTDGVQSCDCTSSPPTDCGAKIRFSTSPNNLPLIVIESGSSQLLYGKI